MNRLCKFLAKTAISAVLLAASVSAGAVTSPGVPLGWLGLNNEQLGKLILGLTNLPLLPLVQVTPPQNDPFYTPPKPLPAGAPGTLLGSRRVDVHFNALIAPLPFPVDAWQIRYLSTDTFGRPEMAIATVLVPPLASRNAPLLSYQTATDSDSLNYATSYLLRTGGELETVLIAPALAQGWKVVLPDFEGLDAQYTGGRQAGHATLDGIRAAEQFAPAQLNGTATKVLTWGYSGGAQATAWAAELQPTYAPELNIVGTAEGGIPVEIGKIGEIVNGGALSGFYAAGVIGLARAYDIDLLSMLNRDGVQMYNYVSNASIGQAALGYAFSNINTFMLPPYQNPLTAVPVFQAAVADNTLGQAIPNAKTPLYIYGGTISDLIAEEDVHVLVKQYCSEGITVQADFFPGEHFSTAVVGAVPALAWLTARAAGKPAPNNCASTH